VARDGRTRQLEPPRAAHQAHRHPLGKRLLLLLLQTRRRRRRRSSNWSWLRRVEQGKAISTARKRSSGASTAASRRRREAACGTGNRPGSPNEVMEAAGFMAGARTMCSLWTRHYAKEEQTLVSAAKKRRAEVMKRRRVASRNSRSSQQREGSRLRRWDSARVELTKLLAAWRTGEGDRRMASVHLRRLPLQEGSASCAALRGRGRFHLGLGQRNCNASFATVTRIRARLVTFPFRN